MTWWTVHINQRRTWIRKKNSIRTNRKKIKHSYTREERHFFFSLTTKTNDQIILNHVNSKSISKNEYRQIKSTFIIFIEQRQQWHWWSKFSLWISNRSLMEFVDAMKPLVENGYRHKRNIVNSIWLRSYDVISNEQPFLILFHRRFCVEA